MRRVLLLIAMQALPSMSVMAEDWRYEDADVVISGNNRSPDQVASFYEGRGFPKAMIDEARQRCFIVWGIHNKTNHVLWMDLEKWTFTHGRAHVARTTRAQWFKRWEQIQAPQNARSTFRWTLLPETLDLQPDEGVGGNVTLAATRGPFDVEFSFVVGETRAKKIKRVLIKGVQCAFD
ncbi:MAG: hypothetical protein OEW08_02395 [Gammaproteobacteria bacterium]|nr:hypothetical protein [Gammaproteobacteria bacterium]